MIRCSARAGRIPAPQSRLFPSFLGTSIEEGLIRSIATEAVSNDNNTLYDQTRSRSPAIGMLHNQILRWFSHAAVK